ncbi:MAG: EamA family transporter [Candidatus Binatia bacterium]
MLPQIIALVSAISYSAVAISARLGLQYSNPLTATCVALCVRTVTLWTGVFLAGGIPKVTTISVVLFVLLGILQTATSLLTFTGLSKIGASRSVPLRSSYPLWSAMIAISLLGEEASVTILAGTILVVAGVVLITWQPGEKESTYRWWHVLFPLAAALFAGIAFPVRRYALIISNEPLFFAALLATVALTCLVVYLLLQVGAQRPVWNRKALLPFVLAGGFEALAAYLSLFAVSIGRVVVVAPIVATSPFWNMFMAIIFLRGLERVNLRTIIGTFCVVAGTISIIMRG